MKRVKVTKRTVSDRILRPSRLLMFANYVMMMTLAVAFGLTLRWVFSRFSLSADWWQKNGMVTLGIIVAGSIVVALVEYKRWTLRVLDGDKLEGPAGAMGERMTISIKEIDWDRTRRSLRSWLKIGNGIYDFSRRRILISPWFYKPADYRAFIRDLGGE